MQTAIELIAAERERQQVAEGYGDYHDNLHDGGEMAEAAACYAELSSGLVSGGTVDELRELYLDGMGTLTWPWEDEAWKPVDDPIRNLVKAGALIVAEIERIQRLPDGWRPVSGSGESF